MTVTDPWGMPISCAAEVAPTYGAAMRAYHDRRSGDVELLQQVVEEDPASLSGVAPDGHPVGGRTDARARVCLA